MPATLNLDYSLLTPEYCLAALACTFPYSDALAAYIADSNVLLVSFAAAIGGMHLLRVVDRIKTGQHLVVMTIAIAWVVAIAYMHPIIGVLLVYREAIEESWVMCAERWTKKQKDGLKIGFTRQY